MLPYFVILFFNVKNTLKLAIGFINTTTLHGI